MIERSNVLTPHPGISKSVKFLGSIFDAETVTVRKDSRQETAATSAHKPIVQDSFELGFRTCT